MAYRVIKFGGTSVASIELMRKAADIAIAAHKECSGLVVVVSAMGSQTDDLIALMAEACPNPTKREIDAITHTGELVSSSLFASVLQAKGVPARSITGSVAGIRTNSAHGNARILDIDTVFLRRIINQGEIPVIAGFQGINEFGEVTTLGRGGSDTTAAALGTALNADECHIYSDVPGVFTADPRICPNAQLLEEIHFEEILELAALGAKILHPRAIEYAGHNQLHLRVKSTFEPDQPGTLISFTQEKPMEKSAVTGITYNLEEAKITLRRIPDQPGVAARLFSSIAANGIDVDVIVQNIGDVDKGTDLSFTVHREQLEAAIASCESIIKELGCDSIEHKTDIAKVSAVGIGMRGHAGIAARMFSVLADNNINIQMISTSEIKVSVIIEESSAENAVRALHEAFGLDAEQENGAVRSATA